jgi:hypothetical protein
MAKKNRHRKSNSDSVVEINTSSEENRSDDEESSSSSPSSSSSDDSSSSSSSSKKHPFDYKEIKVNNYCLLFDSARNQILHGIEKN